MPQLPLRYRCWSRVWAVVVILAVISPVAAQQPINSATGVALFPGGSVVRTRIETRDLERPDGQLGIRANIFPTTFSYGATPNLTLAVTVPWAQKDITTPLGSVAFGELGDVIAIGKYRYFVHNYPGGTVQLAVLGGIKLPTGDTDEEGPGGRPLPMPLQPGSGSTDYVTALTATSILKSQWAAHASLLYKRNTQGERGFEAGDFVNYNLAVNRRVYTSAYPGPEVYVGMEFNGEYTRRHEVDGRRLANSGGNRIFLSPTLDVFLARNWTLEASVQVPVSQDLNGIQPEDDPRFVLGVRFQYGAYLFNRE